MPAFEMAFQQRVDIDDVKNWNRFTVRWWLLAGTPVWFWYSGGVLILWWGSSTRVGFCYSGGVLVPEWGSVTLVGLSHSGGVLVLRLGFWYSGGVLVLRLGFWCSDGVLVPWWVSRTRVGFWYSGWVLVLILDEVRRTTGAWESLTCRGLTEPHSDFAWALITFFTQCRQYHYSRLPCIYQSFATTHSHN